MKSLDNERFPLPGATPRTRQLLTHTHPTHHVTVRNGIELKPTKESNSAEREICTIIVTSHEAVFV